MNASCAPRWRRVGVGVAAAGALLALGGCAAGQHAQTANEVPVVDGVSAQVGSIALRAVTVAPPDNNYAAGADAPLQLIIVNQGGTDDKLVQVTTPAADAARFFADQADSTFTPPPPTPSTSDTASSTGTGTPTDTSTPTDTTVSETPTSTAPAEPPTVESIDLPAGGHTLIGYEPDQNVIQLHGLAKQLFPAQTFPITFRFEHAGAVTFTVSVHLASPPASRPSIDITPTSEG